jgi:transposase
MDERQFYTQIFGVAAPWTVSDVRLDMKGEEVVVHVSADPLATLSCPECDQRAPRYDTRPRRWRHLDTCQFKTMIESHVLRVSCPEHGVCRRSSGALTAARSGRRLAAAWTAGSQAASC